VRACAREGGIACYTQEEIGEAVGLFQQDVAKAVEAQKMEDLPKSVKLLATYTDAEWKPPLYQPPRARRRELACYTQEEIGEAVGLSDDAKETRVSGKTEDLPKDRKLLATYTDAEWKPPVFVGFLGRASQGAACRMLQLHVLFTWPKTPRQDAPLSVGIWLPNVAARPCREHAPAFTVLWRKLACPPAR
jgi:transcriptional regulator with XRE-family HTH domain